MKPSLIPAACACSLHPEDETWCPCRAKRFAPPRERRIGGHRLEDVLKHARPAVAVPKEEES